MMIVPALGRALRQRARKAAACFGRASGRQGRQAGSATVLAVGVVLAGMALVAGALDVARAVATSHRAAAAADLAALAAATRSAVGNAAVADPAAAACAAAARVAERNGGVLDDCVSEPGGSVSVVVSVVSAEPWPWRASGRARAGLPEPGAG